MTIPETSVESLLDRYDVFLLDAYGVLVHTGGALPGAAALLERLEARGKRALIVSNDASRLPATTLARYAGFGLPLTEDQLLTSGMLIRSHFTREGLAGAPCIVLGTEDSERYVTQAGGQVVGRDDESAAVLVVCDDDGYPFLRGIEEALTTLIRRFDRGQTTRLVLPNPDKIYPRSPDAYGIASGSVALVLEHALRVRYGEGAPTFTSLGKPHRPIFEAALALTGSPPRDRVVMLGDQLATDIKGATDFGIASALLGTGLTNFGLDLGRGEASPTYLLANLLE